MNEIRCIQNQLKEIVLQKTEFESKIENSMLKDLKDHLQTFENKM